MLIVTAYAILLTKRDILASSPRWSMSPGGEHNMGWTTSHMLGPALRYRTEGRIVLVITVDKASTGESGDAWGTAMDACIPVIDLIDTTRSALQHPTSSARVWNFLCLRSSHTGPASSCPFNFLMNSVASITALLTFCSFFPFFLSNILAAPFKGSWNGYKISSRRTHDNRCKQHDLHR